TANITANGVTVVGGVANNKTYDGTTNATLNFGGATLSGTVAGDAVNLNSASAVGSFADKNVGANKPVAVSGLTLSGVDATNYTLAQPGLAASITGKGLTVTGAIANDKTYDGTTNVTLDFSGATLLGAVAGDVVSPNPASAVGSFADKN